MENATKALLIAAAVLIAILIISLTLVIYRQGANAVTRADLSEAEAAEFNGKFTVYQGKNVSTTQVNALLSGVFSHNKQELASGSKRFVVINITDKSGKLTSFYGDGSVPSEESIASETTFHSVSGMSYYTVTCGYNGTIVDSIYVKEK